VPPETGFTPPKGADWDDVVLPAVAKKLGITVAGGGAVSPRRETGSGDEAPSGDDDLAVEWDKDGTPIRWEKRTYTSSRVNLSTADMSADMSMAMYRDGGRDRDDRDEYLYASADESADDFGPGYGAASSAEEKGIELTPLRTSGGAVRPLERSKESQSPASPQSPQSPQSPHTSSPQSPGPGSPQAYNNQQQYQFPQQQHQQFPHPFPPLQPRRHPPHASVAPQRPAPSVPTSAPAPAPQEPKGKKKPRHDDEIKSSGCACLIM